MKGGHLERYDDYHSRAQADREKRMAALGEFLASDDISKSDKFSVPLTFAAELLRKNAARRFESPPVHGGHRKRLREDARQDLDLYGLSDVELVELLLSFMIPQKDTNVLAHKLIDKYGSPAGVLSAPLSELMEFPSVTRQVAVMFPILEYLSDGHHCDDMKLTSCMSAAEFFGVAYLGKQTVGTFVALLDENFRILIIEKHMSDGVPQREILSSVCKYYARYVFVARREHDLFPQTFNIAEAVGELAEMLTDIDASLLDYLIFCDYGYYTVGAQQPIGEWIPTYIFVPAVRCMRSPDMYGDVERMYVGAENAEPLDDICGQIVRAIKCGQDNND